jgi:hypothetical protein
MLPTGSFAESIDGRCTFEEIKYVDSLFSVQPDATKPMADDEQAF